jgi:hypothetical protein
MIECFLRFVEPEYLFPSLLEPTIDAYLEPV